MELLTFSQVILVMLARGPYLELHCPRRGGSESILCFSCIHLGALNQFWAQLAAKNPRLPLAEKAATRSRDFCIHAGVRDKFGDL